MQKAHMRPFGAAGQTMCKWLAGKARAFSKPAPALKISTGQRTFLFGALANKWINMERTLFPIRQKKVTSQMFLES